LFSKIFCFQFNFQENTFLPKISIKIFCSKLFYCCKIISSKTGSYQNFHQIVFGRKFFMVANHFLENRFLPKFSSNCFWSKIFYGCKIISSKTGSYQNFHQIILVENFLWLQNHFLENMFLPKFSSNFFWSKIFYGCKIISSRTGSYQHFHQIFFG